MKATFEEAPIRASRLTAYVAAFALALLLAAGVLHRTGVMSTPTALALFAVSFALAGLALLTGAIATVIIWRTGDHGFARTLVGMATAAGILAWPLSYVPVAMTTPRLNDVSTDTKSPPRFVAVAQLRDRSANPAEYPGDVAARQQATSYPDLQPYVIDRPVEDAFELAKDVLRRGHRMRILAEEAPGGRYGDIGIIEAVDRTLIIGFNDDVIVRVTGDQRQSRIDVRSASRYGRHDLGRNAARTRRLLKDFQARLESLVPGVGGMAQRRALLRAQAAKAKVPKRQPDAQGGKAGAEKSTPRKAVQPREREPQTRQRPPKGGFE